MKCKWISVATLCVNKPAESAIETFHKRCVGFLFWLEHVAVPWKLAVFWRDSKTNKLLAIPKFPDQLKQSVLLKHIGKYKDCGPYKNPFAKILTSFNPGHAKGALCTSHTTFHPWHSLWEFNLWSRRATWLAPRARLTRYIGFLLVVFWNLSFGAIVMLWIPASSTCEDLDSCGKLKASGRGAFPSAALE